MNTLSPSCGGSQELQQKRVQLSEDAQHAPEVELENVIPAGTMGWKKPARSSSSHETPVLQSNSAMSPADSKSTNTGLHAPASIFPPERCDGMFFLKTQKI